jgi:hypothetical protein
MQNKPDISRKAFWDTKFEDLDFEEHKEYIIAKIFEYGTWKDMLSITRFYGKEQVKHILRDYPFFFPDTINFISTIFNIPKEKMACYNNKPYHRPVFN